jgi:GH15 family glucan-1,4-alpha-glucosidase
VSADAGTGYAPIDAYAIIGDTRSAALVCRDGSIDWLCWPRFDSPSIFAALLDDDRGGFFRIRPVVDCEVERRYLPDTVILETTFFTDSGSCVLRDLMPVASEADQRRVLLAEREILREVEGLTGEVELEIIYAPRPDYACRRPRLESRGALGIWCGSDGEGLYLRSETPLEVAADRMTATGQTTIRAGQRLSVSLSYTQQAPAVLPPLGDAVQERIARTAAWWQAWANRCQYTGPYRSAVVRSALTLKLLTFSPSGAIVAAPTTSLPEQIGDEKNWDYRFCWLRDASFTAHALYELGHDEEATAFINWALHTTRLRWPELRVLYDVYGRDPKPERELTHLEGYGGSAPVRVGNGAQGQLQLDGYGTVIDLALMYIERGGQLDADTARMLKDLGRTICARWREPDSGIWELRGKRQPYTHSKVMAWVALDRMITLHERHGLDIPVYRYVAERSAVRAEIEQRGFNLRLNTFTQTLGGNQLDAAVLVMPLYGFIDAGHLRMRATVDAIQEHLGDGPLIYRALPNGVPDEGTFGICAFWAVECRAKAGDLEVAQAQFEQLLGYANDVGLFAEEIDARTGAALGNFPQGFTHIGLINAALTLHACQQAKLHGALFDDDRLDLDLEEEMSE